MVAVAEGRKGEREAGTIEIWVKERTEGTLKLFTFFPARRRHISQDRRKKVTVTGGGTSLKTEGRKRRLPAAAATLAPPDEPGY